MQHSGTVATHTIQLFDHAKSRTDALVGFVRQGLDAGDNVLVVAKREHWEPAAARLLQRGVQLDADIAPYRLTVFDATTTLSQLMQRGRLPSNRFTEKVGTRIRRLRSAGARLRVYGEMVDLLASEGDFANALRLEEMWNELLLTEPADLLCGYSSINFGNPRNIDTLSQICHAHSHLRFSPYDSLGSYLLHANPTDPSESTH
jgi:hypothetical protein